jgi:hypothetical protein
MKTLLQSLLVLAVLVISSTAADATTLGLSIRVQRDINGAAIYSAVADPTNFWSNDSILPYTTAVIASANNEFMTTTDQGGWRFKEQNAYFSLNALCNALQQPWSITIDQGLPSQRIYSMSLQLSNLPSTTILPPTVSFPLRGQGTRTLTPNFTFALETSGSFYANLYHFEGNSSKSDKNTVLASNSTSWNPGVTLVAGREYFLDLYRTSYMTFPNVSFTAPVNVSSGIPVTGWQSGGYVFTETITKFTASIPEPSSIAFFAFGAFAIACCGRYRWQKR